MTHHDPVTAFPLTPLSLLEPPLLARMELRCRPQHRPAVRADRLGSAARPGTRAQVALPPHRGGVPASTHASTDGGRTRVRRGNARIRAAAVGGSQQTRVAPRRLALASARPAAAKRRVFLEGALNAEDQAHIPAAVPVGVGCAEDRAEDRGQGRDNDLDLSPCLGFATVAGFRGRLGGHIHGWLPGRIRVSRRGREVAQNHRTNLAHACTHEEHGGRPH